MAALRPGARRRLTLDVLFNLGRIAEDQGQLDDARARYRESLEARPGNEAVRQRLDALAE